MINALNVNKNNKLSFEEFNDLLMLPKKYGRVNQNNIINNNDNNLNQDNQGILSELPLKNNYTTFDKFKFEKEEPLSGNKKLPTLNDIINTNGENIDINIPKERTISGINSEINTNINNNIQNPQSPYQPIMGYEKNSQGNLPSLNALITNQLSKEIIYNENNNKENIQINNNILEDNNIDNSIEKTKTVKDNNLISNANLSINLGKYNTNIDMNNNIEKNKPSLTFLKRIENI